MTIDRNFWENKRVLLTGHTGFKGSWAGLCLADLGAKVTGFSLTPETTPSLFALLDGHGGVTSHIGDIRDGGAVAAAVQDADPEIVIHMAAQALVRRSYREPLQTVHTNVLGTANLLQALRAAPSLKTVLVITSDKVYRNDERGAAFGEDAPLGGDDPYSASKAAQEIVAQSWASSFFAEKGVTVATARAGNVIGGGDFSEDRLIPDIWRAEKDDRALTLRYPKATRPWQHVLDLTAGYLMYIEALARDPATPRALNFGPLSDDTYTVEAISARMLAALGSRHVPRVAPSDLKEKTALAVDAARAAAALGWRPRLSLAQSVGLTAQWYRAFNAGADVVRETMDQIHSYWDGGAAP
ncbi:CDP-glucose 4,6-dehydratase [Varunaivibrio sulfuroxidans]|uniref:CDP-glucose 4,6-dehydratase n=1 Tax=Varunaivibrio sulfuroxidans TaxID=1773489 RepID=A0A4R3JFR6_9PROT|nr:CDP-glucose 4,6-dehydratase [Varunaivibrio sulfuroxidans]TCS64989.1 CDP-glucose 4,6-dehydratase [Varunaivibrio sulfuroxidans]WES29721.1 CDP-glucose 4,6-dehydratase [Varunaivibrio sulfuroxidans]